MIKKVDHIGVAVKDVAQTAEFYRQALGMPVSQPEVNPNEAVKIVFVPEPRGIIELLEPVSEAATITKFLETRGEGLHHLCFEVDDLEEAMRRAVAHGAQLIDEQPRVDLRGRKLVFIHPKSAHGVLIELVQDVEKRDR